MKHVHWALFIGFAVLGAGFFTACDKEEDDDHSHEDVTVTITIASPTEGAMYARGELVQLDVSIEGSSELHGYEISLVNTSNSDEELLYIQAHSHETTYQILETWVNEVSDHSDMAFTVTVYKDHEGSPETKTVYFHCHPM